MSISTAPSNLLKRRAPSESIPLAPYGRIMTLERRSFADGVEAVWYRPLTAGEWVEIERTRRKGPAPTLMAFYNIVYRDLGIDPNDPTVEGQLQVTDVVVIREDHDRLFALVVGDRNSQWRRGSGMLWLNLGPRAAP